MSHVYFIAMNKVHSHKVGLVCGGTFAILHAMWALMVLGKVAQPFMDWILGLHFMAMDYSILPFALGNAILLILVTGIIGYIVGYVIGELWNLAHKEAHKK
ncbi:MAG: hypothetical protein WCT28_00675 [Patescibacteria group bacterium]